MIDKNKVKAFWDSRAATYDALPYESIANLEQDPSNLQLKIDLETAKVFDWLGDVRGKDVVDLGAGVGQWLFRFAERGARLVTAVEYSSALAEIGSREGAARAYDGVRFVVSPAEEYRADNNYDIVFISGLFVYLNDDQVELLMRNLPLACAEGTMVLLRDGTGREGRHVIDDRRSDHLQAQYSAIYRTRDEYIALFRSIGFELQRDENMFEEGNPLNKYPETRLRIYRFARRS